MRCITPQIIWHNREPVLSVDLDPTSNHSQGFYRLATGGADSHLLIWHLREPDTLKPDLLCVADLSRHVKAVNVVRFSPDGNFLASADDDAYVYIWKNEGKTKTEETWLVDKVLRRHLEDIADLSWSADGAFVVTASVDNSAVMWDVKKNNPLHIWSEHNGLVQGIAFDPLGEFVATMSTDRQLRMFNTNTGKIAPKTLKYPDSWVSPNIAEPSRAVVGTEPTEKIENDMSVQKQSSIQSNRLFHDDTLRTFCRRLSFSPKGELLMVPGGILPLNTMEKENSTVSVTADLPLVGTPSNTDNKIKKSRKLIGEKENSASNHGVIIFCRNSFTNPCAIIPTASSYSIATRFCPVYFQREDNMFTYDAEFMNPTKKSERTIACVGKLRPRKKDKRVLMDMPYKLVYAIATNNSIIIGDTASNQPIALIRNIHFTRMSDLAWSTDGRILLVSSTDGYCSIVSFADNELGMPAENVMEATPTCFPILSDVKKKGVKEPKKKDKNAVGIKKTKELAEPKKVQEPKKGEIQLETVFKKMETKQQELETNGKQLGVCKPEANANNTYKLPITPTRPCTAVANDFLLEEKPVDKVLKSKTTPPQRNTLDKWIIKTPKTGVGNTPTSAKTGHSQLRQSSALKGKLLGFTPEEYQPTVKLPRTNIDTPFTPISSTEGKITSAEIARLENAPIIIDLESEFSNESSSLVEESQPKVNSTVEIVCPVKENLTPSLAGKIPVDHIQICPERNLESDSHDLLHSFVEAKNNPEQNKELVFSKVQKEKYNVEKDKSSSAKTDNSSVMEIDTESLRTAGSEKPGEKRPASSPLSSHQTKQPRRVQLITLSSSLDTKKSD